MTFFFLSCPEKGGCSYIFQFLGLIWHPLISLLPTNQWLQKSRPPTTHSDFSALGLPLCHANLSPTIWCGSEKVLPFSSVALPTFVDLDCISRSPFAAEDCVMPLKLKCAAVITIFMGRVYISTKAWLGYPLVRARSSPVKHNPFSEELVSSPLPGPVLAGDNTD